MSYSIFGKAPLMQMGVTSNPIFIVYFKSFSLVLIYNAVS